jgi:hypothetical protein
MAKVWAQMTISEKIASLHEELDDILRQQSYTQKDTEKALRHQHNKKTQNELVLH